MDPVSESCVNLTNLQSEQKRQNETYGKILGSCMSVSNYEEKSLKNLLPQIIAAFAVMSYRVVIGITLTYSAILIPQLTSQDSDVEVTKNEASWIASILPLTSPIGSILVGFLIDRYGRLSTMKMAAIPAVAGWSIIALAQNVPMLIIGRALTGFANALGVNPSIVYLTEISRKDMRGSLLNIGPTLASGGMILTFVLGWTLNWRQVAWGCTVLTIIPSVFVMLIPESPSWLVSKGRVEEAKKSLEWINKYQPHPKDRESSLAELQLALLEREELLKRTLEVTSSKNQTGLSAFQKIIQQFSKPTGYKPLTILLGLSVLQQFSGIFIFFFYSINIFQDVGIPINPYLASIFIGILRLIICLINTYIMKIFGRRPLIIFSALGMALTIFLSGLYTAQNSSVPLVCLLLYVMCSMVGMVPIPFTMAAEVFPLEIRGLAYSLFHSFNSFTMFLSLKLFTALIDLFGGIQGLQFFFSGVCVVTAAYIFVLLPETHKKKLGEIEEYFKLNFVFLGAKREEKLKTAKRRNNGNVVLGDVITEEHGEDEV